MIGRLLRYMQATSLAIFGDSLKYLDGDSVLDVTNSKNTLSKLLQAVPGEVEIGIVRNG